MSATATTTVGIADSRITKTDSPDPVATSGALTYTIIVTNNGDRRGGTPRSPTPSRRPSPCVDHRLRPDLREHDHLPVRPRLARRRRLGHDHRDRPVTGRANLSNTATASRPTTTRGRPGTCRPPRRRPSHAPISTTKTDSPDPIVSGNTLTYTIIVTNNGTAAAADTSVADTLPAALTRVDIEASGGTPACETSETFPCALGSLAAGASVTITVTGTVTGCANLSNTATASTTTTQSDALDLSATATTTVACPTIDVEKLVSVDGGPAPSRMPTRRPARPCSTASMTRSSGSS